MVEEASAPGQSISAVARRYGLSPSLLFRWRRLAEAGTMSSLDANEDVVPQSEAKALRGQIRDLQRLLGKKTQEAGILQDALRVARDKKLLCRCHRPRRTTPGEGDRSDNRRIAIQSRRRLRAGALPSRRRRVLRKPSTGPDEALVGRIRPVIDTRPSYGYKPVTTLLNALTQAYLSVDATGVLVLTKERCRTEPFWSRSRTERTCSSTTPSARK